LSKKVKIQGRASRPWPRTSSITSVASLAYKLGLHKVYRIVVIDQP